MRRLLVLLSLLWAIALAQRADAVGIVTSWSVGHQPFSVAVDPANGRIYVSNSGTVGPNRTGTVSVVDPATGAVTSLNTTGVSDTVAIDPGARRLYVANAEGPGLDVFDLDSRSLITSVAAGGIGVAVDAATHRVYTTRAGSLSVVDGATNTVVGTKPTPCCELWFAVVLDPGLHRVYVSNVDQTSPTLLVLDDRDLSTIKEVVIPQAIRWALAVDPSSHDIYVGGSDPAGSQQSSFFVLDPTSLTITRTVPLTGFPSGIAVAPGARRIFMTDLSGQRILELDHTTFAITQVIALPWGPAVPTMHPDGRLYVPAYQGFGADVVAAVDVGSAGPVVDSVILDPASPRARDVLHAIAVAHGSQGQPFDPANLTYEWLRNGTLIGGVPSGPYLDLSGFAQRGDTVTVRVTAHEGEQTSAPQSASVVVVNSAPVASVGLDTAAPATNSTLHAVALATDADNDPVTFTFTWNVNGVARRTVSGPGFSDSFDLSPAGNGDHGDTVRVEVVASDGMSQSAVAFASAGVVNSAPVVSVSLSDTAPRTNDVLVATASGQDLDGDPLTFTYAWGVHGVVRRTTTTAATTDSFDLSIKDNGDNEDVVTVTVIASDGSASSAAATASAKITAGRRH